MTLSMEGGLLGVGLSRADRSFFCELPVSLFIEFPPIIIAPLLTNGTIFCSNILVVRDARLVAFVDLEDLFVSFFDMQSKFYSRV